MGRDPSEYGNPVVRASRRRRNLRRLVVFWLVRPLVWLAERVPHWIMQPTLRALARPLMSWTGARRKALSNLEHAFGADMDPSRRRAVVRAIGRNMADFLAEYLAVLRHGASFYQGRIDDTAARARIASIEAASPRGFIGVTGHIGNWELLAHWTNRQSVRGVGAVIGKRLPNPHLNQLVERLRQRLDLRTFYRDEPPTKPVRLLRQGQIVGVVPDQDVKLLSGTFIDFFGMPAYTPVGPARLALAAGVPLVCAYLLRRRGGFEMIFEEPIHPRKDRPRGDEIVRLTEAWSRSIERMVRQHPEQWAWFHSRWKTTPQKLAARGRQALVLDGTSEQAAS